MDLLAALAATWPPAETRRLGPWTLRRGLGGGNRVSAATLEGTFEGLEAAETAIRDWGQRPLVMAPAGAADLDTALAARGWARADPTLILAAEAATVARAPVPEEAVDCDGPLACMAAIWDGGGIGPARRAVMARAPGPKAWILGRDGDAPAACAFVAAAGGVAMLHALEVAPWARRRGLGAAATRAAAAWAAAQGAPVLALAVTEGNAPARALYRELGLVEATRYHYRIAPEP